MRTFELFIAAFLCLASCKSQANETPLTFNTGSSSQHLKKSFWDSLPQPTSWVNDFEDLFNQEEERKLDSVIAAFDKEAIAQITIVTLDTNSTVKERFDDLVLHIAKKWGVGQKGKDNGVVIGISAGYRRIRICNGYGIERILTDEETKQIIGGQFTPNYKQAEYYNGTYQGLMALIEILRERLK